MSSRTVRLSRRTRLRIALLALCALLFQQVAVASYACSFSPSMMPMAASASVDTARPNCLGMSQMGQRGAVMCAYHCSQQTPVSQDSRLPADSAIALPPQPPVFSFVRIETSSPFSRGTPGGTLGRPRPLSCVLLI